MTSCLTEAKDVPLSAYLMTILLFGAYAYYWNLHSFFCLLFIFISKTHEIFKQMSKDIEVGKDGNMVETDG